MVQRLETLLLLEGDLARCLALHPGFEVEPAHAELTMDLFVKVGNPLFPSALIPRLSHSVAGDNHRLTLTSLTVPDLAPGSTNQEWCCREAQSDDTGETESGPVCSQSRVLALCRERTVASSCA